MEMKLRGKKLKKLLFPNNQTVQTELCGVGVNVTQKMTKYFCKEDQSSNHVDRSKSELRLRWKTKHLQESSWNPVTLIQHYLDVHRTSEVMDDTSESIKSYLLEKPHLPAYKGPDYNLFSSCVRLQWTGCQHVQAQEHLFWYVVD